MIILIIIIVILVIWFISISNNINKKELLVEEAKSTIEIALMKRYETLTQSVKCAKEFSDKEFTLILEATKARRGMSIEEIEAVSNNQTKAYDSFRAVAESYPNIKSNQLYQNIQNQLSDENNWVASSKRLYNSNVRLYNLLIVNFPSSIVATLKFKRKLDFIHEEVSDKNKLDLF